MMKRLQKHVAIVLIMIGIMMFAGALHYFFSAGQEFAFGIEKNELHGDIVFSGFILGLVLCITGLSKIVPEKKPQ